MAFRLFGMIFNLHLCYFFLPLLLRLLHHLPSVLTGASTSSWILYWCQNQTSAQMLLSRSPLHYHRILSIELPELRYTIMSLFLWLSSQPECEHLAGTNCYLLFVAFPESYSGDRHSRFSGSVGRMNKPVKKYIYSVFF